MCFSFSLIQCIYTIVCHAPPPPADDSVLLSNISALQRYVQLLELFELVHVVLCFNSVCEKQLGCSSVVLTVVHALVSFIRLLCINYAFPPQNIFLYKLNVCGRPGPLLCFGQSLSVLEEECKWTVTDDRFSFPNISY